MIIGLENQFSAFLRVAVLYRFSVQEYYAINDTQGDDQFWCSVVFRMVAGIITNIVGQLFKLSTMLRHTSQLENISYAHSQLHDPQVFLL